MRRLEKMIQQLMDYARQNPEDKESMTVMNRNIFRELYQFQDDVIWMLAASRNYPDEAIESKTVLPYIHGIGPNNTLLCICIFSEKDLAVNYSTDIGLTERECIPISFIEFTKLMKYWLLRGVYGIILNDGGNWVSISIVEYLKMVSEEILQDPEMNNDSYGAAIMVYSLMESKYPMEYIFDDQSITLQSATNILCHSIGDIIKQEDSISVKIQTIFCGETTVHDIKRLEKEYISGIDKFVSISYDSELDLPMHSFQDIFFVGLNYSPEQENVEDFPNKEESEIDYFSGYQHPDKKTGSEIEVTPLEMDDIEDDAMLTVAEETKVSRSESMKPTEDEKLGDGKKTDSDSVVEELKPAKKNERNDFFEGFKTAVASIAKYTQKAFSKIKVACEDLLRKYRQKKKSPEEKQVNQNELVKEKDSDRKSVKLIFGVLFVFSLLAIIWLFILGLSKTGFQEAIENEDFVLAAEIYNKEIKSDGNGFLLEAEPILQGKIDDILLDYAANNIDAVTTSAKLLEFEKFPVVNNYTEKAMLKAAALEESKNSYVWGIQSFKENQYLTGLSYWMEVLVDDVNYRMVSSMIEDNELVYVSSGLLECSVLSQEGKIEEYKEGLKTLLYWFPENEDVKRACESTGIQTSAKPDTNDVFSDEYDAYPVLITNLSCSMPESNGAVNLYIDWTNQTEKVIKDITFMVQSLNEFGKPVYCYKGNYSMYVASASGPWKPGDGMSHETMYWEDVWYNSSVKEVKLLRVDVEYSDGTIESIADSEKLQSLFASKINK